MNVPPQQSATTAERAGEPGPESGSVSGLRASTSVAVLATVAALTAVGMVLRIITAGQSIFADELSTFWIITAHGPRDLLSIVHSNAEITPPLYFVLGWISVQFGDAPELVRLPSLVAGTLSIPLIFLIGERTVGRRPALLATAITVLSPFMTYYAAEARAYGVMMFVVLVSTYALLVATETGRKRWWALYAAGICLAMYAHYTCVFALAAQFGWALYARPAARKQLLIATGAAAVLFLPWITGVYNDFTSPTGKILDALSPFSPREIGVAFVHWTIAYPYAALPVTRVPGVPAVIILGLALAVAAGGAVFARGRAGATETPPATPRTGRLFGLDDRVALVVVLALSVPVGEALVSLVSTNLFGVRNLAASWPFLALSFSALVLAARPPLAHVATALTLVGFLIAAGLAMEAKNGRPNYQALAKYIEANAQPGDVVIDGTGIVSPGPPTPLDVELDPVWPKFRAGAPDERNKPYDLSSRIIPLSEAVASAVAATGGTHRVWLAQTFFPDDAAGFKARNATLRNPGFPAGWTVKTELQRPALTGSIAVRVLTPPGFSG